MPLPQTRQAARLGQAAFLTGDPKRMCSTMKKTPRWEPAASGWMDKGS